MYHFSLRTENFQFFQLSTKSSRIQSDAVEPGEVVFMENLPCSVARFVFMFDTVRRPVIHTYARKDKKGNLSAINEKE